MVFDQQKRNENENLKFAEGSDGKPVVRVSLIDGIQLSPGQALEIKDSNGNVIHEFSETGYKKYDHRGFLVFEVNANGDLLRKGRDIKL